MFRALRVLLPLVCTLASLFAPSIVDFAEARGRSVSVRGYTRKDGTYVPPHQRSAPDGNFNNNWSTKGNVNPYTGESGTKESPPINYGRDVHVDGYTRKDGTYVPPHYRSAPDGDASNNWSTEGNVNPYTGEPGTKPLERTENTIDPTADPPIAPIIALQQALVMVGHSPGPVDGISGPRTVRAMSRYLRDRQLDELPFPLGVMELAGEVRGHPALAVALRKLAVRMAESD